MVRGAAVLERVLRESRELRKQEILSESAWQLARVTAETLFLRWQVGGDLAAAVLVAAQLKGKPQASELLAEEHGSGTVAMASEFLAWQERVEALLSGNPAEAPPVRDCHLLLSQMFALAHGTLPDCSQVLLVLADADARVRQGEVTRRLAGLVAHLFVPLATMLGMRRVRERWVQRCMPVLDQHACEESVQFLRKGRRHLARTARQVRTAVEAACTANGLKIVIKVLPLSATGWVWRSTKPGQGEVLRPVYRFAVLCQSQRDCYLVLNQIHAIKQGQPVREAFLDAIADPRDNGYMALHTALRLGSALIDFRVCTPHMHRLNRWGFLAARYHSPERYTEVPAWWAATRPSRWHATNDVSALAAGGMVAYSPRGTKVYLSRNSSVIDFAYAVHTRIGDHAVGARVNGETAALHQQVHAGDIVEVITDPRSTGPGFSWLPHAATKRARQHIRKVILQSQPHPGRKKLVEDLLDWIEIYRTSRNYHLVVEQQDFDEFLADTALVRRLTLPDLYAAVKAKPEIAHEETPRFLSRLFARALRPPQTDPRLPHRAFSFCTTCRPVPSTPDRGPDELVAHWQRNRGQRVKVHRAGCPECNRDADRVAVEWADVPGNRVLTQVAVRARDRYNLLGEILEVIYRADGASVRQVRATTSGDGGADVECVIETVSRGAVHDLVARLEPLPGITQVFPVPLPLTASGLATPAVVHKPAPHLEFDLHGDYDFYDRVIPQARVLEWLREPGGANRLVLHGHGRVGKTSLVRYLIHRRLAGDETVSAHFIDLQRLSSPVTMKSLAEHLVQTITEDLKEASPPNVEPSLWLSDKLRRVARSRYPRRLLIAVDEVSFLRDQEQMGKLDGRTLRQLATVVQERTEIKWLLVIHEVHRHTWAGLAPLMEDAVDLPLTQLDGVWAEKLIEDIAEVKRFRFEPPAVADLLELTAGNPYLIKQLFGCLVDPRAAASGQEQRITLADVEEAADFVINEETMYLRPFCHGLSPQAKAVLAYLAAQPQSVPVGGLTAFLVEQLPASASAGLERTLDLLEWRGLIHREGFGPDARIQFALGLLRRWARQLSLAEVLEECQEMSPWERENSYDG